MSPLGPASASPVSGRMRLPVGAGSDPCSESLRLDGPAVRSAVRAAAPISRASKGVQAQVSLG